MVCKDQFELQPLEQRVLLSADGLGAACDSSTDDLSLQSSTSAIESEAPQTTGLASSVTYDPTAQMDGVFDGVVDDDSEVTYEELESDRLSRLSTCDSSSLFSANEKAVERSCSLRCTPVAFSILSATCANAFPPSSTGKIAAIEDLKSAIGNSVFLAWSVVTTSLTAVVGSTKRSGSLVANPK